jgi:hypothetical protein
MQIRRQAGKKTMKNILKAGVAAAVLMTSATGAMAQTGTTVYSAPAIPASTTTTIIGYTPFFNIPIYKTTTVPGKTSAEQFAAGVGSKYSDSATVSGNTEAADTSVANSFTMTGNVTKDCSFYGGGTTAHDINLGTIGVRTGNNDNVSQAFNQRDDMTVNVNSATAGCNFNNTVTIAKDNGASGLVNKTPGGYDPAQFTAEIPYSIEATWNGSALNSHTNTVAQKLQVASNQGSKDLQSGAWRSQFNMDVSIPAQSKALVAGTYSDKITVTLATL